MIDKLVEDLAGESGEVRPIELQIVGAQLQEKNITKLKEYKCLGENPKVKLVEQYLEQVIQDCGSKNNQTMAWLVLYLLTNENETRPLKSKLELADTLKLNAHSLDLILKILLGSGLIFLVTKSPGLDHQQAIEI